MSAKLPVPREVDIQRAVMDYLTARGFRMFRRNTGVMRATYKGKTRIVRFSQVGAADLYGWHRGSGRHIEVEVKGPGGVLTPEQAAWLENARADGAVAFVADSLEGCERQLKTFGF